LRLSDAAIFAASLEFPLEHDIAAALDH